MRLDSTQKNIIRQYNPDVDLALNGAVLYMPELPDAVRLSQLPVLPGERFILLHEVLQHVRRKARIPRVKQGMRHPFAVRQHAAFQRTKKQLLCLRPRTEHNLRQRTLHTAQQRRNDTLCCVLIIRF